MLCILMFRFDKALTATYRNMISQIESELTGKTAGKPVYSHSSRVLRAALLLPETAQGPFLG